MGLSNNIRLKSAEDIAFVYQNGKSNKSYPIRVVYNIGPEVQNGITLQYAVVAPKRNFKKAVSRNRIKRMLREVVRNNHTNFIEQLSHFKAPIKLLVIYYAKEIESYAKFEASYLKIQAKMIQDLREHEI